MAVLKTLQPLISGVGLTRAQASASGIQVVMKPVPWSKKAAYIRNMPYTNISPHRGQIEARIRFGEIARKYKGAKGFEDGLPVVAAKIKKEMAGFKAPSRLSQENYPSKARRTFHTLDELKAIIRA